MSALATTATTGHNARGMPMTRIDTGSSGFTAVNGNGHKAGQIEPNQSSTTLETPADKHTAASIHLWNPHIAYILGAKMFQTRSRRNKKLLMLTNGNVRALGVSVVPEWAASFNRARVTISPRNVA